MSYRHRQAGLITFWATFAPAIVLVAAGLLNGKAELFLGAAILAVVGTLFSTLTIEVTPKELVWYFGPGVWRKRVKRSDIESAAPVTNKWWWGWGVRLTPRGWLYNVGGLKGVEIALMDGHTFRLGSDEPEALARALTSE
jgi:hypothetical protein